MKTGGQDLLYSRAKKETDQVSIRYDSVACPAPDRRNVCSSWKVPFELSRPSDLRLYNQAPRRLTNMQRYLLLLSMFDADETRFKLELVAADMMVWYDIVAAIR